MSLTSDKPVLKKRFFRQGQQRCVSRGHVKVEGHQKQAVRERGDRCHQDVPILWVERVRIPDKAVFCHKPDEIEQVILSMQFFLKNVIL